MTLTDTGPPVPGSGAASGAGSGADLVVLLDQEARPIGTAPRLGVHDGNTPLHLAFSVHLMDGRGRTLLTRRALTKTTWPGVWTNSCCGHPRPGEPIGTAVRRRTRQELGVDIAEPVLVLPDFRYRAVDATGVVEHEVCPVHAVRVPADLVPDPDPAEVAEHDWVDWADLHGAVERTPMVFSPWLVLQVRALGPRPPLPAEPATDPDLPSPSPGARP